MVLLLPLAVCGDKHKEQRRSGTMETFRFTLKPSRPEETGSGVFWSGSDGSWRVQKGTAVIHEIIIVDIM